jgi:hypothetical protein
VALADKVKPCRPEVPLISKPFSFACLAERLAGTTAGPHGSIVGPTGAAQGITPNTEAGEEMALGKPGKVSWYDILNAPCIHFSGRNMPGLDKLA